MAELYVQRKKRSVLPWILLALVVLGVIGWFVYNNYYRNDATEATPATQTTAPPAGQPTQ
ncbi:MAG TPA: hypothetical protein VFZ78_07335 [Flavisolibacter sp.]